MAFWGVEVRPGKPFTHFFDRIRGRLHISQATLGNGSASKKSVVQCNVGNKSPVLLCALLPEKTESCALALEFEEAEDVIFSVVGPRSVYLTGYYLGGLQNSKFDDDTESYGEDIANTDMEESNRSIDEDEYEDSFIDDNDPEVIPPSPISDCGEVHKDGEEVEDEKPRKEKGQRRLKKKHQMSKSDDDDCNAPKPKVVNRRACAVISDSDDDDDDRLPFSFLRKTENSENSKKVDVGREGEKKMGTETSKSNNCVAGTSPEISGNLMNGDTHRQSEPEGSGKDSKPKKKTKEHSKKRSIGNASIMREGEDCRSGNRKGDDLLPTEVNDDGPKPKKRRKEHSRVMQTPEADRSFPSEVLIKEKEGSDATKDNIPNDQPLRNKKNLKSDSEERSGVQTDHIGSGKQLDAKRDKKKKKGKAGENNQEINGELPISAVMILSNGMEIEELDVGKPESKVATKGKKVMITFTGRLGGGNIFDSNEGSAPFKFRLGAGDVIEGWEIGIEGMRVGGRRILKIPPSLGFGSKGHGENIPPNSWVIYDIELIGVH